MNDLLRAYPTDPLSRIRGPAMNLRYEFQSRPSCRAPPSGYGGGGEDSRDRGGASSNLVFLAEGMALDQVPAARRGRWCGRPNPVRWCWRLLCDSGMESCREMGWHRGRVRGDRAKRPFIPQSEIGSTTTPHFPSNNKTARIGRNNRLKSISRTFRMTA